MNLLDLMVKIGVDDQASSRVSELSGKVKSGLGNAAKVGAAAVGAAVTATGAGAAALVKTAMDGYSSYEQLAGGVEKLFGEESGAKLMQFAQEAYKTSGMSANQYMEQATSFSASLISSLGGDTEQAAELADVAMRSMSDNVNVFGSDMESVQNAFQGFAKQNYTMLDNLKLGYGGTKDEMQRLIEDAANATDAQEELGLSVDATSMSFDNIVKAIQVVQHEQGIAGTTAKEAGRTIEGSVTSMKAAWSNLVTELGKPDADIGARMTELVTSIFGDGTENNLGVFGNVLPAITSIVQNASVALTQAMPYIQTALETYLPVILDSITQLLPGILSILVTIATAIAQELPNVFAQLLPVIVELAPTILEAGLQVFLGLVKALTETGPELMDKLIDVMLDMAELLVEYAPEILEAMIQLLGALVMAIAKKQPEITAKMIELLVKLVQGVIEKAPEMLTAGAEMLGALVQSIAQKAPEILQGLANILTNLISSVGGAVGRMVTAGGQLIGGLLTAIGGAAAGIVGKVGEVVRGGINAVGTFVSEMISAGSNLVQGLIDGIADNFWRVADTITGGLRDAVNDALEFLGIASPSKLFEWIGEMTMKGAEGGLQSNAYRLADAMGAAMDEMRDAAEGGVEVPLTASAETAKFGATAAALPQIVINVNDAVIRETADVDRIFEYVEMKMQRKAGLASWNPLPSMT